MEDPNIKDSPFAQSPVVPELYDGNKEIQFRCYKGISCFNACCKSIDITLTPYDILRLKKRLGMTSGDFLVKYTFPFEFGKDDIAGVKMKPVEGGTQCQFMTEEGCSVYEDRPASCRYYPVALVSMRRQTEYTDNDSYALVKEEHCKGHEEQRKLTINEYRQEQGLEDYDTLSRGWRQLILKKKSSGPYIGKPSQMSRQMFFMACYDLDRFSDFVMSDAFNGTYDLPEDLKQKIYTDDVELMLFAFRFLSQTLFGEQTIELKDGAYEKRLERRQQRLSDIPPPPPEDPYESLIKD